MATLPFRFPPDFANSATVLNSTKTLDGRVYRFRFRPSTRANDGKGAWYLDLFDVLAAPIALGLKVVLSTDFWGAYRTTVSGIPPGNLVVRRTDTIDDEPRPPRKIGNVEGGTDDVEDGLTIATLGSPLLVIEYVEAADAAALAAAV